MSWEHAQGSDHTCANRRGQRGAIDGSSSIGSRRPRCERRRLGGAACACGASAVRGTPPRRTLAGGRLRHAAGVLPWTEPLLPSRPGIRGWLGTGCAVCRHFSPVASRRSPWLAMGKTPYYANIRPGTPGERHALRTSQPPSHVRPPECALTPDAQRGWPWYALQKSFSSAMRSA
jgi:hypothetical protein